MLNYRIIMNKQTISIAENTENVWIEIFNKIRTYNLCQPTI